MANVSQQLLASYGGAAEVVGCDIYTSPGTYSWTAPEGVTSVSIVAVGGGGKGATLCGYEKYGGPGAGLGYKNNYTVIPGNSYTVVVGAGGTTVCNAGDSYFVNNTTVKGGKGGLFTGPGPFVGDGGGRGGYGGSCACPCRLFNAGGGGAGGYSNGCTYAGSGSSYTGNGGAGTGGSAGGGKLLGGGGGVGIYGQGSSGAAQTVNNKSGYGGSGGSGNTTSRNGQTYGGGGAWQDFITYGTPANGAVRIVWPGTTRQFPSTNVGA